MSEQEEEVMRNFVEDALLVKGFKPETEITRFDAVGKYIYTDGADIVLEESSALLRKVMAANPFGMSDIDEYNKFLDLSKECITSRWIELNPITISTGRNVTKQTRRVATFGNLKIVHPSYDEGGKTYFKTPQMCRLRKETYGATWNVTVTLREGGPTGEPIKSYVINIGQVPVMLGSRYCILNGKSPEELRRLGEDPGDPFGYFIVSGQEKVVLKQEKLVVNRALLMAPSKGKPTIRITVKTIRGTIVVELLQQDGFIEMKFPSLRLDTGDKTRDKATSFNVVRVIRMVGRFIVAEEQAHGMEERDAPYQTVEEIEEFLMNFIDESVHRPALNKLASTFVGSFGGETDEFAMMDKVGKAKLLTQADLIKMIEPIFNNDLFTHLTEIPTPGLEGHGRIAKLYEYKVNLLGFMLGRYLETLCGYRPLDDRDSWSNKRAVGAGCMMEQLFRSNWYKILATPKFKEAIDQSKITTDREFEVTETFRTSFTSPNWGVKGRPMKNNVAQTLGRTSVLETYSHLNTVDVSVSRNNVANSIRQIQQTQWNVICPVSTPEGDNCGIVKNTSITVRLSLERRDTELLDILLGNSKIEGKKTKYVLLDPGAGKTQVMLNGKFIGWSNDKRLKESLQRTLLRWRRQKHIPFDVAIIQIENVLHVDMSPSRPIFPYLLVDYDTQELLIDQMELRDASVEEMMERGAIEYISAWEQEYAKVAPYYSDITDRLALLKTTRDYMEQTEEDFKQARREARKSSDPETERKRKDAMIRAESAREAFETAEKQQPYEYCQIDPSTFMGVLACAIPYPDHNQAPRNTFQASMSKQAIGMSHINHLERNGDGKSKVMVFPTRPIVETEIASMIGGTNRNCGNNILVAFAAVPFTEEDGFCAKKEAFDMGLFRSEKYFTYSQDYESTNSINQVPKKPTIKQNEVASRYDNIGDDGIPYIGAYLREGDCVIGKVTTKTSSAPQNFSAFDVPSSSIKSEEINESVCLRVGDEGVVDKVFIYKTPVKTRIVVKMRSMHIPSQGDKFSPRNAQKGTIGKIIPASELPYTKSGIIPDFFVNPSSIPSRMTLSYFFEMMDAKTGAMQGKRKNGTAFRQDAGFNMEDCRKVLLEYGMDEWGEEELYSAITGEKLVGKIFTAPVYMQALKHQALSKNQCRGEGPVKPMTRQPPKNKSNRGGIRFGEMERDAACAFGASSFVLERLCITSDAYTPVFCTRCGYYADNKPGEGYACPLCKNKTDFGNCRIPYAYKLLEHLLGAACIRLRLNFISFEESTERLLSSKEQQLANDMDLLDHLAAEDENIAEVDKEDMADVADNDEVADLDY